MKTIKLFSVLAIMAVSVSMMSFKKSGYFNIYVENQCSEDIKLNIRADGSSSEETMYAGKSEQKSVKEGYELKTEKGFFKKITENDEGKTIVICK